MFFKEVNSDLLLQTTVLVLTHNPGVVVVGQHPLTQSHQQPEGFLLWAVEQQDGSDNVHRLKEEPGEILLNILISSHYIYLIFLFFIIYFLKYSAILLFFCTSTFSNSVQLLQLSNPSSSLWLCVFRKTQGYAGKSPFFTPSCARRPIFLD